ncbi:MAG: hypothetical protein MHM6MM_002354 [Cercozoa sp. M6MM]
MMRQVARRLASRSLSVRSMRFFSADAELRPALTHFSEEEDVIREAAAAFSEEIIRPDVVQMDEESAMTPAVLQALYDNGFMGIEIPEEYGGAGMSFTQSLVIIEEISKVDPAVAVLVDIQNTLVNALLMRFGTDAQKENFLPKLAAEFAGSFCLTEATSGSDAFAMKTRAVKEGDDWILNGGKMWISNSSEAGLFIVFAQTDPSKGHKGITAFLVERENPGLTIAKKEDKMGIRASSTREIVFEDCRVTPDMVLGEVGQGGKLAISLLNEGRIGIAAQMVGLAQGAFNAAMPYVHERKQFGQPVADFQGMQFQFAEVATQIEAARLLVYNAARLKEAGKPCIKEAAMAKLYASRVAEKAASMGIEWMGGVGFTREFPNEKFYRDAKIGAIYEGTSNMMLQTIAKQIAKEYK